MKVGKQMYLDFDVLHDGTTENRAPDELPLTEEYLLAVEERTRRAMTGPWLAVAKDLGENWSVAHWNCGADYDITEQWAVTTDHVHASETNGADGKDNAIFIAHARTDVPLLLLEVRRLRAALAKHWER